MHRVGLIYKIIQRCTANKTLNLQLNVLLTVHYNVNFIPVTNLMHKFLYSYNVTVLYMFRVVLCSSTGGQIVCIQHMISSLSMSGRGGFSKPVYFTTSTTTLRDYRVVSTSVLHDHHNHS